MDLRTALETVQEAATNADRKERAVHRLDVGQHIRQGDLIIERIADWPANTEPAADRTLGEGSSGASRHVLREGVELRRLRDSGPLDGPLFAVDATSVAIVEHPEHADISIADEGVYRVRYERDLAAEELARVAD